MVTSGDSLSWSERVKTGLLFSSNWSGRTLVLYPCSTPVAWIHRVKEEQSAALPRVVPVSGAGRARSSGTVRINFVRGCRERAGELGRSAEGSSAECSFAQIQSQREDRSPCGGCQKLRPHQYS